MRAPDGKIVLICKGADSIIAERLNEEDMRQEKYKKNVEFVDKVADEGLRTLFIAERVLPEETFNDWFKKKKEALNVINNRELAV